MKTKHALANPPGRLTTAWATRPLPLLLLFAVPGAVQAQSYGFFDYSITNDVVTITGYTGSGGLANIPASINGLPVTSIGNWAFFDCTGLANVTVPNSVTNIGVNVFVDCNSLTAITVAAGNSFYSSANGVLFDKSQTTVLQYPPGKAGGYEIPSTVTSIGDSAFADCYGLIQVTIPNSVTNMGYQAFAGCTSLASVTIPNSVMTIGGQAFGNCWALTNVTIPSSVTAIGDVAFFVCSSLTAITVDPLNPNYSSVDGVLFDKGETRLIQYPAGKVGSFVVPNCAAAIEGHAFYFSTRLTNVVIPNSVSNIGDYAFANCTELVQTTIGNRVTSIGEGVFMDCSSLINIAIPEGVTSIGYDAFAGCAALTSVAIPDGVTRVGQYAFYACTRLTAATLASSVSTIDDWAFGACSNLTSVYFQGNIPGLGSQVFAGDSNATAYYLPGTTGWGTTFGGLPTRLWLPPPSILTPPLTQTAEAGATPAFWVDARNMLPGAIDYQWYFSVSNSLASATNASLDLPNVQPAQAGAYTVVVTSLYGSVTSPPALLSVIPPVERSIVPALQLPGGSGGLVHLEHAQGLPALTWLSLSNVTLSAGPQLYFDLTQPLPPQRFYRAWQATGPPPALSLILATEIPLTGAVGTSVQVDYINEFGPTNAWVTLATVTLTNSSQLYFDVTAFRQAPRLYRLVPGP